MKARFLLSLIVGASLLATTAFAGAHGLAEKHKPGAQRGGGGGGGRAQMMKMREEMYKKLHLSAAQKKKIDAYDAHTQRAREAAMKAHPGDRAAMRPMMEKMRAEHDRFMKKTLSSSQYAKYQAEMKKRQAEMKAMRAKMGGGPGAGRPKMLSPKH